MWIETESGQSLTTETGENLLTEGLFPAPLQNIIPSYLYQEYADDQDLQAFVASFNALTQGYLTWFNETPLSVYTSPNINGPLLDWIMNGIYGIERPVFSSLRRTFRAGLNSLPINTIATNANKLYQSGSAVTAADDYYKRVGTWTLYLGDGRRFTIIALRKKIARFLYGVNGTDVTLTQAENVSIIAGPVPPPIPAVTLSSTPGGSIAARIYGARATYVNSIGETLPGPASSISIGANNLLVVNSPVPANGATAWYPYVNVLATNPGHFRGSLNSMPLNTHALGGTNRLPVSPPTRQTTVPIPIGTNWTEPTSGLIVGAALPTVNTSNTTGNLIITVPAGTSSQFFQQAMQQALLPFPFQLTTTVVVA